MSAPLQQQPQLVVTTQQNELQQHHFQQQQHHQQQQQQQPITAGNDNNLAQYGLSTLYYPDKKEFDKTEVKQMEFKYNILASCLKADDWEAVNVNLNEPAIFVSPGTDYNKLEDLVEGIKYVNPYNYGHHKSNETLNRLNELYCRYVLGTDMGRRLIQQYLPSLISSLSSSPPPKVNKEDNKLSARTLNFMMGELSLTDQTPLQQNEEAIAAAKLLLEQLEINRQVLLRQESKKKRQLELVPLPHDEDYNTNEKRPRTEREEDDVVDDDSVNASQDLEFENSMDGNFSDEENGEDDESDCSSDGMSV